MFQEEDDHFFHHYGPSACLELAANAKNEERRYSNVATRRQASLSAAIILALTFEV